MWRSVVIFIINHHGKGIKMRKIEICEVVLTWSDGTKEDVSRLVPLGLWEDLEKFMDSWEAINNEEEANELE